MQRRGELLGSAGSDLERAPCDVPVRAHEDASAGLHLTHGGPISEGVEQAVVGADHVHVHGYTDRGRGCGRRACPRFAAAAGDEREAQSVDEVEGRDRFVVTFEAGVWDAGAGAAGGLGVQDGVKPGAGRTAQCWRCSANEAYGRSG